MSHSRPHEPDLPESLESPDVGFVAAAGVYAAVALVAVTVSAALALGGSPSAVFGTVSSAATLGLVVGAVLASRSEGVPERLGRRPRSLASVFVVPATFAVATAVTLVTPAIASSAALGTGFGAVGTAVAALGLATMARTRYARAMTPDEPLETVPRLHPNQARRSIGVGIACFAFGIAIPLAGTRYDPDWIVGGTRLFSSAATVLFTLGTAFVLTGISYATQFAQREEDGSSHPLLPDRQRRKVFGSEWGSIVGPDPSMLPELRVHETGLVVTGSLGDRFVPWADVTDVRLTPSALVVEHRGRFDCRCDRSVIDDPEAVRERIDRRRTAEDGVAEEPDC